MIKRIQLCTDGSPYAQAACRYAMEISSALDAELRAIHVVDSRILEGPLLCDSTGWVGAESFSEQYKIFSSLFESQAEAISEAVAEMARDFGISVKSNILSGHPLPVLLAADPLAELIILGKRGSNASFSEEKTGSIAERMARSSDKPCLLTPLDYKPMSRALVAYDGSHHAGKALHTTIELAKVLKMHISLVGVTATFDREKAQKDITDAETLVLANKLACDSLILEGDPEEVILSTLENKGCNLLACGACGHSRIRELIIGSTTSHLIEHANVPVLVAR